MKTNNIGLAFAKTCNDHNNRLPKGRGDCFDYGSWYGCSVRCPTFADGECKIEDLEAMAEMIKKEAPEEINEYIELYPILKPLLTKKR